MTGPLTDIDTWLLPLAVAAGGFAAGLFLQRAVLPLVARAAARSSWKYDDVLVDALRGPIVLWSVLIGLRLAFRILPIARATERALGTAVLVLGIIAVTWALARFIVGALRAHATPGAMPGVSLIANITRVLVFAVGLLVVLQTLGISITPLITALGVGGLAVGLALQDTLANFFAGIRILASGRIHPGDFIRLETGQEGFVEDITWGQTMVRAAASSVVIVPNARLAQAITTNFNLPTPPVNVVVPVGVAYASDLDHVERVALDVARAVIRDQAPRVLEEGFEPVVRFHTFADSSINLNVVLRAGTYDDRFVMQHDFIKRLHARFRAEQIAIPFPQRDVHLKGGAGFSRPADATSRE